MQTASQLNVCGSIFGFWFAIGVIRLCQLALIEFVSLIQLISVSETLSSLGSRKAKKVKRVIYFQTSLREVTVDARSDASRFRRPNRRTDWPRNPTEILYREGLRRQVKFLLQSRLTSLEKQPPNLSFRPNQIEVSIYKSRLLRTSILLAPFIIHQVASVLIQFVSVGDCCHLKLPSVFIGEVIHSLDLCFFHSSKR